MDVGKVDNTVKTSDVLISGQNGNKLSEDEAKLAKTIAGLDGKDVLSKNDLEKLKKMTVSEQIKYINNALKDTGYKVAKVYDMESDETTPGISWTSNGVFINFSQGGETIECDIMGDSPQKTGHLSITYKK